MARSSLLLATMIHKGDAMAQGIFLSFIYGLISVIII